MTVFHNRSTNSYTELSGDIDFITGIPGQNPQYSGGELPPLSDTKEQYPLDQTTSVVDMR